MDFIYKLTSFLKVKEKLKSDSAPMLNINIQHILCDMEYIIF